MAGQQQANVPDVTQQGCWNAILTGRAVLGLSENERGMTCLCCAAGGTAHGLCWTQTPFAPRLTPSVGQQVRKQDMLAARAGYACYARGARSRLHQGDSNRCSRKLPVFRFVAAAQLRCHCWRALNRAEYVSRSSDVLALLQARRRRRNTASRWETSSAPSRRRTPACPRVLPCGSHCPATPRCALSPEHRAPDELSLQHCVCCRAHF